MSDNETSKEEHVKISNPKIRETVEKLKQHAEALRAAHDEYFGPDPKFTYEQLNFLKHNIFNKLAIVCGNNEICTDIVEDMHVMELLNKADLGAHDIVEFIDGLEETEESVVGVASDVLSLAKVTVKEWDLGKQSATDMHRCIQLLKKIIGLVAFEKEQTI